MSDMNCCIFSGRLGRDPETRYTKDGKCIANFSVAVNRVTGTGEERKETTEWIPCVCFGRIAEVASQYLESGRHVMVRGRWVEEKWEDRESGEKKSRVKLYVDELQMLPGNGNGNGNGKKGEQSQSSQQTPYQPPQQPQQYESSPPMNEPPPSGVTDDEIPF